MKKELKKELKKVRVIRHLRSEAYDFTADRMIKSNLGGVTLLFDLDYMDRTVNILFSMAAKDENFDRDIAITVAENNGVVRSLDLDAFRILADEVGGFVPAYQSVLRTATVSGLVLSKREKQLIKNSNFYI